MLLRKHRSSTLAVLAAAAWCPVVICQNETQAPAGLESLLETGRQLWEQYAPAEVQEEYAFPGTEDVRAFLTALENDLSEGSFTQLAAYLPEARNTLALLRLTEEGDLVADWLEPRLDLLAAAEAMVAFEQSAAPTPRSRPMRPGETVAPTLPTPTARKSPNAKEVWMRKISGRAPPSRSAKLVPGLKKIFRSEGVPDEWVWLAEVESSMNPKARSPVGARGLFQFMPATAERFGMSASWPDERTNPEKSARAAATYMRVLFRQFESWPLVLAAYNAGEGRVGRLLKETGGKRFETIEQRLPAETRMYVPKVLATVAIREGVVPEALPPPIAVR